MRRTGINERLKDCSQESLMNVSFIPVLLALRIPPLVVFVASEA